MRNFTQVSARRAAAAGALAAAMGAAPAHAAVTNLGPVVAGATPTVILNVNGANVSFEDWINFNLAAPVALGARVQNSPLVSPPISFRDISGLNMDLWNLDNNTTVPGGVDVLESSIPSLVPGNYRWVIQGTTTGINGGTYVFGMAALAPVPEPQALVMFVVGAGLLGALSRRGIS